MQVVLPDVERTREVGESYAGERAWYSDAGLIGRNRIQSFDATFGVQTTDRMALPRQAAKGSSGKYTTHSLTAPARNMVATFDDSKPSRYWTGADPGASVKVAGLGVTAEHDRIARGGGAGRSLRPAARRRRRRR